MGRGKKKNVPQTNNRDKRIGFLGALGLRVLERRVVENYGLLSHPGSLDLSYPCVIIHGGYGQVSRSTDLERRHAHQLGRFNLLLKCTGLALNYEAFLRRKNILRKVHSYQKK